MKYPLYCLLLGIAGLALPTLSAHAANSLVEDWHEQQAGATVDSLMSWKQTGKGPVANGQIVTQDGKKILEIKATSDQAFEIFGIKADDSFDFKENLEVSIDAELSAGVSTLPDRYLPSAIIEVSSGHVVYQVNLRADGIQIGKNDPAHPNPDPSASHRDFTVLTRSQEQMDSPTSTDFQDFKLKMKRSSGGITLTVTKGPNETQLATITDPTNADFGAMVSVSIKVENFAIMKIDKVNIKAD